MPQQVLSFPSGGTGTEIMSYCSTHPTDPNCNAIGLPGGQQGGIPRRRPSLSLGGMLRSAAELFQVREGEMLRKALPAEIAQLRADFKAVFPRPLRTMNRATLEQLAEFYAAHNYPLVALAYRKDIVLTGPVDYQAELELEYVDHLIKQGLAEGALSRLEAITARLSAQAAKIAERRTQILEQLGRPD